MLSQLRSGLGAWDSLGVDTLPRHARKSRDCGKIEEQLRASGNDYWATQVGILKREVMAWSAQADMKPDEAAALMRASADEEDAIEKLPVTPGPIVPAREQLGYLLMEQNHSDLALKEFETALANAPGRRGALRGRGACCGTLPQEVGLLVITGELSDRRQIR